MYITKVSRFGLLDEQTDKLFFGSYVINQVEPPATRGHIQSMSWNTVMG